MGLAEVSFIDEEQAMIVDFKGQCRKEGDFLLVPNQMQLMQSTS